MFLSLENLRAECFLNYLVANYVFLNFDLLSIRSLNFPKISASFLIGPFFIIGDCVYTINKSEVWRQTNVDVEALVI